MTPSIFRLKYQRQRTGIKPRQEEIRTSLVEKFSPMLSSSLGLVFAFGILVFPASSPQYSFCLLCALITLTTLAGDLVIIRLFLLERKDPWSGLARLSLTSLADYVRVADQICEPGFVAPLTFILNVVECSLKAANSSQEIIQRR